MLGTLALAAAAFVPLRMGTVSSRCAGGVRMAVDAFPSREVIGIDGRRAVVLVYSEDDVARVDEVLGLFDDSGDDYAQRGCRIVALRSKTKPDHVADFPSIVFRDGLEGLDEVREELELTDLSAVLYRPRAYLVDPDGSVRAESAAVRATTIWSEITRALHAVTVAPGAPSALEAAKPTFQEDEAQRQASYSKNAAWAEVLEKDESLRQPTRGWFDGLGEVNDGTGYLAAGEIDQPLLPAAGAQKLTSEDGVEAPEWYAQAKARADAKVIEDERKYGKKMLAAGPSASSTNRPEVCTEPPRRLARTCACTESRPDA